MFNHAEDPDGQDSSASTKSLEHDSITWIDVENPTGEELAKLAKEYPFHPLHLEESLLIRGLPRLEKEDDYLFLLLHLPARRSKSGQIVSAQVSIFLGKHYVITVHDSAAHELREWFDACEVEYHQREAYFKKSAPFLLYNIVGKILDTPTPFIEEVLQELDVLEDKVFNNNDSDIYQIGQLRRKVVKLRRIIGAHRIVLQDLDGAIKQFAGENMARYYRTNTNKNEKLWEIIEEAKETVEIYKDADFTASAEKTNEILAILTLIFTFTIPPTVIGTFFGMNILLPGGIETGPWTFWGRYTTLIIVCIVSGIPVLLMYWYFKKKKWF